MKQKKAVEHIKRLADETTILRKAVVEQLSPQMAEMANLISGIIGAGGKILVAGNGGSAADAQHFAGEMIVRLTAEHNRQSLPMVALCSDVAVMTAAANDFGFENVFARQVEGLGQKGDLLFVISTSGNSPNLVQAVKTARDRGMHTAGLLGGIGGTLAGLVDRALIIPHPSTQRIQEEHIFIIHLLVEMIESDLI